MNDQKDDFRPVRRRWFVERRDFGRQVAIVQTEENQSGAYRFLAPRPYNYGPDIKNPPCPHFQIVSGNEPLEAFYTPAEAQELMDALWAAGMRPTRR